MSGDLNHANTSSNKVIRTAPKLKYSFCETHIAVLYESGSHDCLKPENTNGHQTNNKSRMQRFANTTAGGD